MSKEDLRRKLAEKKALKAKIPTSKDVWCNGMVVDPYFPRAAYYAISKGKITAHDLAQKFVIDGKRTKSILNQLLRYHVVFATGDKFLACMPKTLLDKYLGTYKLVYEDLPVDIQKAKVVVQPTPKPVLKPVNQPASQSTEKTDADVPPVRKTWVETSIFELMVGSRTKTKYSICADCGSIIPKGRALCDACMTVRLRQYHDKESQIPPKCSDESVMNAVNMTEDGPVPVHAEDFWKKYQIMV